MIETDLKAILNKLVTLEAMILKLQAEKGEAKPMKKWMTVKEAALYFGMQTQRTLRRLIAERKVETTYFGEKRVLVNAYSVSEYLEGNKRLSQSDIDRASAEYELKHLC